MTKWKCMAESLRHPITGKFMFITCTNCWLGTETLVYETSEGNEVIFYKYCPNCGERMYEEVTEENIRRRDGAE